MRIEDVRARLKDVLRRRDDPMRLPTDEEWRELEGALGTVLPLSVKSLIALLSDYSLPGGEFYGVYPLQTGVDDIPTVLESERRAGSWPGRSVPLYGLGNGDYFVLDASRGQNSPVFFLDHGSAALVEVAASADEWIESLPRFFNESD